MKRRKFINQVALSGLGTVALSHLSLDGFGSTFAFFDPTDVKNPLLSYPARDWEKTYRDLWSYDSEFTFLCAPNDTHNCLLKAHVKNNTVVRIAPSFGFSEAEDIYGNKASPRWEPRCCQKGLALSRRFYGDRRVKYPVIREGYLKWIKDGYPRGKDGRIPEEYMQRGKDSYVKITWDEAYEYSARALENIARMYSGKKGIKLLTDQGYDPLMVEATKESGTQTLKLRGGMSALGVTRIFGMTRLANSLALLDSKIRGVGPDEAKGSRGWDSYAWHTDLPPGHPMVTGQQTVDFDLVCTEHTNHIVVWGMNWITTKMPDSHWLTEARIKGAKVTVIACEYSATSNKADNALIVRPGVTPALALGFINVIISESLFDSDYVKKFTDMPLLVRMDTQELLKPEDVISGYQNQDLSGYIKVLKDGEKPSPATKQGHPFITEKLRKEWGDFTVWDQKSNTFAAISRDDIGDKIDSKNISPALEGKFTVTTLDGKQVEVRPVFDLIKQYVTENYDPKTVSEMTWAPENGIRQIARDIAANQGKTLFAMGMGPNQFFNNDLKDRTVLLLAALTKNIGRVGGNVGSYAGNYRGGFFSGIGTYIMENPFNIQLDETKPAEIKKYVSYESAHFFNNTDRILRVGEKVLTGKSHMPTPTKCIIVSNGNSLLANAKGHYENVVNAYPKVEFIGVAEWWWTGSCEYADIVYAVDSWAEFKAPDATMSVTNPFLYIFPRTPMQRIYETRGDIEVLAGISSALGKVTGDNRFHDYFKFVHDGKPEVYLQRIFNTSNMTKGYNVLALEEKAKKGIPALMMTRTYPKYVGHEQANEGKQWYTKSGRLEFYRHEKEFIEAGENLPVHREPVDSTYYEPNVIVSKPHPSIKPDSPEKYGVSKDNLSTDIRQGRNVVKPWSELNKTTHPLTKTDKDFKFIFHTPKYRHGAHTTPVDTDIVAVWFGPFGDMHRKDKRNPFVAELYVDINPLDAKELGVEDGDYVYIDADPEDRPFRGWQKKIGGSEYELSRLLCRARYYPGTPRGVTRMWHNAYGSTYGSVAGSKSNPTGLAKNPKTNYQAMFRRGSHQSCTRAWLKPTLMTDSLVRKNIAGQVIDKGFELDVHGATGAPRESFVKISLAEKGGVDGNGNWEGVQKMMRPTYENDDFKR
ncbi:MAG: molybdopterin oxidoreductase [Bacteroidetes bacterium]|nr:MAG: molybdopterin oxidoreductase [Bacteroidota bacterium]